MIYAPNVEIIRDENAELLDEKVIVSVLYYLQIPYDGSEAFLMIGADKLKQDIEIEK